jgi:hypothetical protein
MRVVFTGDYLDPPHMVFELDAVPPIGAYVTLDGSHSRYVSAVRFDLNPNKWDVGKQRWVPEHPRREPWTVWCETRIGRSPILSPQLMIPPSMKD